MNKILLKDLEYIFKNHKNKNCLKNKKIFLIGCEGFIGFYFKHYLINYFKKLKIKELILADKKFKKKKLDNSNKKIEYIKFDIKKDKIKINNIDIIINLASVASPVFYRQQPLDTIDVNINGLRNILEYSKKRKKTVVLYFSTSEIYGDPNKKFIPTDEQYNGNVSCTGPRACYDESKRLCESLCYIYGTYFKLPIIVVRPFNNYGPGLQIDDGRLPADIAKSVITNRNIDIFSNGKPTRSYCYIADAIVGYLNCLKIKSYQVFNIGNDKEEISVEKFAKKFVIEGKKIFGIAQKIKYKISEDKMYLKDNPNRRKPDISKAKKLLRFNPKISLTKGISSYLEFLKLETKNNGN